MMANILIVAVVSSCAFVLAATLSYKADRDALLYRQSDDGIAVMENELQTLKDQIRTLASGIDLMPVEHNWLIAHRIVSLYPDLIWRSREDLEMSTASEESSNAWGAVMIASPDLVLAVMRLIQNAIPAEVTAVQLDQQQGVLSINILGVLK